MAGRLRSFSEWTDIFQKWKVSGLTVKEFCKAEGVSESRFYDIRQKIETRFDRHSKKKEVTRQTPFIPIEIKSVSDRPTEKVSGYLEIMTPSGHLVRIH